MLLHNSDSSNLVYGKKMYGTFTSGTRVTSMVIGGYLTKDFRESPHLICGGLGLSGHHH